jgi:hypothetical protein
MVFRSYSGSVRASRRSVQVAFAGQLKHSPAFGLDVAYAENFCTQASSNNATRTRVDRQLGPQSIGSLEFSKHYSQSATPMRGKSRAGDGGQGAVGWNRAIMSTPTPLGPLGMRLL